VGWVLGSLPRRERRSKVKQEDAINEELVKEIQVIYRVGREGRLSRMA